MPGKSVRFKRLLAALIDWNLSALPALVFALVFRNQMDQSWIWFLLVPLIIAFPVCFVLRDFLFRGRSIGKRLFNLTILDRRTLQPLTAKQLVTRNLLFILYFLDVIVLLISGSSLGDRAVGALVVPMDQIPEAPVPRRTGTGTKKTVISVIAATVAFFAALYGIVYWALERVKEEPLYQLAHSYLTESETFAQMDAEPSDAKLTGYHAQSSIINGVTDKQVTFTFQVQGQTLEVICHEDDDGWYVCGECTDFE